MAWDGASCTLTPSDGGSCPPAATRRASYVSTRLLLSPAALLVLPSMATAVFPLDMHPARPAPLNRCLSTSKPSCPPDQTSNGIGCVYPDHPTSYTFDGHNCAHYGPLAYPPGTSFDDTSCISREATTCPKGTAFSGSSCASSSNPSCPPGTTFNGNTWVSANRNAQPV